VRAARPGRRLIMIGNLLRFLVRGPGTLRWPAARWGVTLIALAGAAMLVWSAVIHLDLWDDGYRDIPTIGPLFLAGSIANIVVALLIVAFRRLVALLAGAGALVSIAGGLLLSVHGGLFGYTESLSVPYAMLSLYVEFAGAGVLVAGAIILALAPVRAKEARSGNPFPASFRS
jgi:hypothetical protein